MLRKVIYHQVCDVTVFGEISPEFEFRLVKIAFGIQYEISGIKAQELDNERLSSYAASIGDFLDGRIHSLDHIPVSLHRYTEFEQDILSACRTITYGTTDTYGGCASRAGHAGAVRAAAQALRKNDFPLVIPCHRVIRKNGDMGGFMGSCNESCYHLKKRLIQNEACAVSL